VRLFYNGSEHDTGLLTRGEMPQAIYGVIEIFTLSTNQSIRQT